MNKIYLDNAATTAVAPEVRQAMDKIYADNFGNPSSIHTFGQEAKKIVDDGRHAVSAFVGCQPEEIIFTSGGSESDNLAIRGIVDACYGNVKLQISNFKSNKPNTKYQIPNTIIRPHVITSAVEHHAVLHTVRDLEQEGLIEATYIKPDGEGLITPEMVKDEIRGNTALISIIYVNNETGVVTPIREIGLMIEKENAKRIKNYELGITEKKNHNSLFSIPNSDNKSSRKIYYHTDAVQGAEFFNISPDFLKVDLLTFTAHKFHGPKGIGVLYIRKGTPLKAQVVGGAQEFGMRAGTENVAGIAGLAKALDLITKERQEKTSPNLFLRQAQDRLLSRKGTDSDNGSLPELIPSNEALRISKMRDKLIQEIVEKIPGAILNGSEIRRDPNIINISFTNAEGEAIILNLDFMGIAVSSGSACTSRSLEPSHVLSAMGIPPEKAHGSIRFSLSRYTTEEEIDRVLEVLPGIIKKLRKMSPFNN